MRAVQFVSVSSCAWCLLKHFRCKSVQIIRVTDDRWIPVSRDISWTVLWVCGLSSWLRTKSLIVSTFSSALALHSLRLPGRLSTVPVSCNFFNSLLTPCFVQLFSRNSSVNLFCWTFIKLLSSSLNTMLIADKHCCDEFPVPQIDHKSK